MVDPKKDVSGFTTLVMLALCVPPVVMPKAVSSKIKKQLMHFFSVLSLGLP